MPFYEIVSKLTLESIFVLFSFKYLEWKSSAFIVCLSQDISL